MSTKTFHNFEAEAFFVRRLGELGHQVFAGITEPKTRKERIRAAIIDGRVDQAIIGRDPRTQKAETFAAAFARHYGEPLHVKQTP